MFWPTPWIRHSWDLVPNSRGRGNPAFLKQIAQHETKPNTYSSKAWINLLAYMWYKICWLTYRKEVTGRTTFTDLAKKGGQNILISVSMECHYQWRAGAQRSEQVVSAVVIKCTEARARQLVQIASLLVSDFANLSASVSSSVKQGY